jgi:hypothetical protein
VALCDVSEECITSITRVERISMLGTLAVTSNRNTLQRNTNYMRKGSIRMGTRERGWGKEEVVVTANSVPSSLVLFILMMEVTDSSETSVLTRATSHHITSQKTAFFVNF